MGPDMLVIGSRGSKLALAQTTWVKKQIAHRISDLGVSIKVIKTSLDDDTTTSIRSSATVGVFVKEIEQALLAEKIDLAVHSMKDVPTRMPAGLEISAIPEREEARDAFVTNGRAKCLADLPKGSRVGTGSLRRQAQILALYPDLMVMDIRGNIETRLKKLQEGNYDAIILACAGLKRLGMADRITSRLDFSEMLPAPGQGALAIETRINDRRLESVAALLDDYTANRLVSAERTFLLQMGGGCNVPVAVHACLKQNLMQIDGLVASPDGKRVVRESIRRDLEKGNQAATELADMILAHGGRSILSAITD
jgi:hydroxymethylbilane synthase